MKLSRESVTRLNRVIDDWVPPKLRDSRAAAWAARRLYRELPVEIDAFKDRAFTMSRETYADFYRALSSKVDLGDTDLTEGSMQAVIDSVVGPSVLDVACGRGLLASALAEHHQVIGCDVALATGDRAIRHRAFTACEARIEELPFADGAFDTVVSTHTLEHVPDLHHALDELRRVARRRLVIVVPQQRPYRVTFNPHVHFFPYRFSLLAWTGTANMVRCDLVGGDWLYVEAIGGDA